MKIAIVSDIHGNLTALESVLAGINEADCVVCLGDVAATGPQPNETISFLRKVGWPSVLGNTDETLARQGRESFNAQMPEAEREKLTSLHRWTSSRIDSSDRKFLGGFKPTIEVRAGKSSVLCYHGSPRSNKEQLHPGIPDERLSEIFEGRKANVYAGVHTHAQMVRKFGSSLLINPGSVGLPFFMDATGAAKNPAWAEYAILTLSGDNLKVDLRRKQYSISALREAVLKSGMPDPAWWLRDWISRAPDSAPKTVLSSPPPF